MNEYMFGVLYETDDGKVFHICRTQEEAKRQADNIACMGYVVTVFDYDIETATYLEFYKL